jgi:hypothetical protein
MIRYVRQRRRAVSVAVPLTVFGVVLASLSGAHAFAQGGTAKPPPGAVAPFVTPTLPDPAVLGAPAAQIHGFEDTGLLQAITLAPDNTMCPNTPNPTSGSTNRLGGTLTINGGVITVPCNTVIQMPANTLTWADFVTSGPDPSLGSGYPSFEVRVVGNVVGTRRIAGLL